MRQDGLTELAMMFKEREPRKPLTMTTGTVISAPPNPKVRLNDGIVLYKENLVFAASIANDLDLSGKEVILMPVNRNLYYALDKAVKF